MNVGYGTKLPGSYIYIYIYRINLSNCKLNDEITIGLTEASCEMGKE